MFDANRHRGPVTSTAPIPGRRSVLTGGYDGAVGLFDLDTGRFRRLGTHRHLVNRVVVDEATGTRAASCSSDYTIRLWDLDSGQPTAILQGHADDVEDFVFLDPATGASASRDHRILVWNLATGAIAFVLDAHEKDVLSLACHAGFLYSSGDDKTLRVWDVGTGRLVRTLGPFELETDTCAIDPVHHRILLGCDDGAVRVFDAVTGELQRKLGAHRSGIKKVAVAATGDFLSAAYDQRILLWSGATLEQRVALENVPHKWERSFSFSGDGQRVYAGTFDGTLLEWDAASGAYLRELGADGAGNACFNRVAAAPGMAIAVADDGLIRLAEFSQGTALWGERVHPSSGRMLMNAVAIDASGTLVATGAHDQKLHIYRQCDGRLLGHRELHLGEGPINYIAIARHPLPHGDLFVACYSGRVLRIDAEGEVRARLSVHEGAVKSVRVHPTLELGVSCSADGTLRAWTFQGAPVAEYLGHAAIINDVDMDAQGQRIASVSRDFTLKVYELESGRLLRSFALGRRSLKCVCFASDELVLVGDYWGGLIVVNLRTGTVQRRQIATNGLSSLALGDRLVLATSYDGSLSAIDAEGLRVLHRIEAMRQRPDLEPARETP